MNFKPFYINIEGMSDEHLREIFNKTIVAGAHFKEDVDKGEIYDYFGVDYDLETYFWDDPTYYSNEYTIAQEITLDQVDEHLGLIKLEQPTTLENTMTNKINDLRNTAIKLEGMRNEDIQAYLDACEQQGIGTNGITIQEIRKSITHLESTDLEIGDGYKVYEAKDELELNTQLINFTSNTTWTATPVLEREVVTLFGTEYYADMIQPLLESIKDAKVDGNVMTPTAGSGNPPDKKQA